jgi:hypothetical protein
MGWIAFRVLVCVCVLPFKIAREPNQDSTTASILHRENIKQVCERRLHQKILTIDTLGRATELADIICIERKRILR